MQVSVMMNWARGSRAAGQTGLRFLHIYRVNQKKGRSQNIIVFHELLSLGCINFKNLGAHHEEEVLRFPKHPLFVKVG